MEPTRGENPHQQKKTKTKMNKKTLLSVLASATAAFIVVAAITSLSLVVSPIFTIIFLGFPMLLAAFAVGISFTDKSTPEYNSQVDKFLTTAMLSAGMALVSGVCSALWWAVSKHYRTKTDSVRAIWIGFGFALIPWTVAITIGISLYFTKPGIRRLVDSS